MWNANRGKDIAAPNGLLPGSISQASRKRMAQSYLLPRPKRLTYQDGARVYRCITSLDRQRRLRQRRASCVHSAPSLKVIEEQQTPPQARPGRGLTCIRHPILQTSPTLAAQNLQPAASSSLSQLSLHPFLLTLSQRSHSPNAVCVDAHYFFC